MRKQDSSARSSEANVQPIHSGLEKMPSFKERFRSSRKYKKNKDGTVPSSTPATANEDTPVSASGSTGHQLHNPPAPSTHAGHGGIPYLTSVPSASASSTTTAGATGITIDDHTGSAAMSTYHSMDPCEC